MVDQYLLTTIFGIVSLAIPASMLIFSKLIRPRSDDNDVATLPYESAEESFGEKVEVMHEYLHYFVAFLAFEIITVIVIIWSTFQRPALSASAAYVIGLLIFGFLFEVFLIGISRGKE